MEWVAANVSLCRTEGDCVALLQRMMALGIFHNVYNEPAFQPTKGLYSFSKEGRGMLPLLRQRIVAAEDQILGQIKTFNQAHADTTSRLVQLDWRVSVAEQRAHAGEVALRRGLVAQQLLMGTVLAAAVLRYVPLPDVAVESASAVSVVLLAVALLESRVVLMQFLGLRVRPPGKGQENAPCCAAAEPRCWQLLRLLSCARPPVSPGGPATAACKFRVPKQKVGPFWWGGILRRGLTHVDRCADRLPQPRAHRHGPRVRDHRRRHGVHRVHRRPRCAAGAAAAQRALRPARVRSPQQVRSDICNVASPWRANAEALCVAAWSRGANDSTLNKHTTRHAGWPWARTASRRGA